MKASTLLALLLCASVCRASDVTDVAAWIKAKRKESPYDIAPGVTASIVKAGRTLMFGDGVQTLGGVAADEDSLFEIGSLSKTMVALGLSTLVTAKKLSFDSPVRKHLGANFQFGPHDYVSQVLTVRDLLTHRTGLAEGQGDAMAYFATQAKMVTVPTRAHLPAAIRLQQHRMDARGRGAPRRHRHQQLVPGTAQGAAGPTQPHPHLLPPQRDAGRRGRSAPRRGAQGRPVRQASGWYVAATCHL